MLKGYEKAAAVLSLLGDELSHKVLSYLPERSAIAIINASERLKTPTKDSLMDAVAEFNEYMVNAGPAQPEAAFEPEAVPSGPEPVAAPAVEQPKQPLDIIQNAGPAEIAKALQTERPEISAYVLSHLPVEKIYEVLTLLKENRSAVEERLITIKDVPITKDLEEKIMKAVSERLL